MGLQRANVLEAAGPPPVREPEPSPSPVRDPEGPPPVGQPPPAEAPAKEDPPAPDDVPGPWKAAARGWGLPAACLSLLFSGTPAIATADDAGMFRQPLPAADANAQGRWDYPPLRPLSAEAAAKLGSGVARTMALLEGSTPERHNHVRIVVYGQSLSKQSWAARLREQLMRRYPYADIEFHNPSIGGFVSTMLKRTLEQDVIPLYPDLVILHDFGREDDYEEIIRQLRTRTTTEILLQNDPANPGQNVAWHDQHSWQWMPALAARWGAEVVDIRSAWRDYVADQNLKLEDLLVRDKVHLNDRGNFVWAEATLRHLSPQGAAGGEAQNASAKMLRTMLVGKDVVWRGNKLVLPFTGNKVEVIAEHSAPAGAAAQVRIDGKAPSQIAELYSFTRPNADANRDWPWDTGATIRVDRQAAPLLEDWTIVFTSYVAEGARFGFDVIGSKTGYDGSGQSDQPFVSRSRRVVLAPDDWFIEKAAARPAAPRMREGYKVTFQDRAHFQDTYVTPPTPDAARTYATTLVQGLPVGKHTLELQTIGRQRPAIAAIRIYVPMAGPLTADAPAVNEAAKAM